MIDGVKFSLVDRLGALSGGASGSGGAAMYNSAGEAGGGEYEGGYEVSNAEGVRLMVMDAPTTTWAEDDGGEDEEDGGAWEEEGDGDVVDIEAMPLDE